MRVSLVLNGSTVTADADPHVLLVDWLRANGLTGVRVGCETSTCGACTVLLDGSAVKSCTLLTVQMNDASVTTIEGVATGGVVSPVQEAFMAEHGLQCGFCTPGFIMSATALLATDPEPSDEEIEVALEGNLCRCTGYINIMRAVRRAASVMRGETPEPVAGRSHERAVVRHVATGAASHEELGDTEVV